MGKPQSKRKTHVIFVKASEAEKRAMAAVAERSGLGITTWLRNLGMEAVQTSNAQQPTRAGKRPHNRKD